MVGSVNVEKEVLRLLHDPVAFMGSFMEIPDKQQVRRPFQLWPVQQTMLRHITGRTVFLKPAQIGCTAAVTGLFLFRTITRRDTTTVLFSQNEFATQRLLQRVQIMYDSIPTQLKPEMDHKSSSEKRFPDINSVIYIDTARASVAGRGEPIHNLLFSECGFYQPGTRRRIIIPALQRVPPTGTVVMESTPNGEDEILYPEVQKALKGESTFNLLVLYWWLNPDNILLADYPGLPAWYEYTEEERILVELHNLTEDQIRWRRWKIKEAEELFWQEHLENLTTCFLVMGEPYYDPWRVLELSKLVYPAPHSHQGAQVWYPPEDGIQYVIGVDPGLGKKAKSVATVWRDTFSGIRHEATLAGLIEPATMATKTKELAYYYNEALIIPEANAHGLLLTKELNDYRRVYRRRDVVSGKESEVIGWLTTSRTKRFMMEELARQLHTLETHDEELIRQIGAFRELGAGKPPASTVADDYHDSACLGVIGLIGSKPQKRRGFLGTAGFDW